MTGPRLFGIPATEAPVVAVLRRGPSAWFHVGRWDLGSMTYHPGAWLHGTLYPQRCDLSPDGRWLSYFTLRSRGDWPAGATYIALSRLPWLTALAAWGTCGTWTSGLHFVLDRSVFPEQAPDVGDARPCQARYGLVGTRPASFAVERRRGWSETPETPPRDPGDMWDQARTVVMHKPDPAGSGLRLIVQGWYAAFRAMEPGRFGSSSYSLDDGTRPRPLEGVQWADWSADGWLLVATDDGRLECRAADGRQLRWAWDLSTLTPQPVPPPVEATRW